MPYTSEVDGNTRCLLYFTAARTIGRLASKSSSNTRSGCLTYEPGVAIATSGRITSHLRTWYSTHSLLIVMSPSKKWKRGLPIKSEMRSALMSMPYTSQSVVARMRLDRWWPMKPFTPSISTFFIAISLMIEFKFRCAIFRGELRRAHLGTLQLEAHHSQHALPADRIRLFILDVKRGRFA